MPTSTNDELQIIEEKLKFIGLDLNCVPNVLKKHEKIDNIPITEFDEKTYKVYKYIPINKIEILITKSNRLDSIYDKYSNSSLLYEYLVPEKEEDMEKHAEFLKMLNGVTIKEIQEIEEEQNKFQEKIPFEVKYKENYLWQIYYNKNNDTYIMLVSIQDLNYASLFYIIKEKIKEYNAKNEKKIFVPISYLDYSEIYLNKEEISDIIRYLWLFTKEWPLVYEVYDKNNEMTIQIVGKTYIYEKMESTYKILLNNKEEANKFYKLVKALFILQTEFENSYSFETKISKNGGLEFAYNSKILVYDNLSSFIKEEYIKNVQNIKALIKENACIEVTLKNLKEQSKQKEEEYLIKHKQVATYLECRKTFLGKVRYYFRSKKKLSKTENKEKEEIKEEITYIREKEYEEKSFYTIEDLLNVCNDLEEILTKVKKTRMDIKALELKIENTIQKIANATMFIDEIEMHKKSIFEFWKFANKDNTLALTEGESLIQHEQQKIDKIYDYEEDLEEIGIYIDKIQREKLSKEECDCIYITTTDIINDLNQIKNNSDIDFTTRIQELKDKMQNEEVLFNIEEFDIFGNISEDKNKINTLLNKKHRESKKNKYKILDISKNTTKEEYQKKIYMLQNMLSKAIEKIKINMNINIYLATGNGINTNSYEIFNINPEEAIKKLDYLDKISLYRINLKNNIPSVGITNIVEYDNNNKTLPEGMNNHGEVLVDTGKLKFELKKQKLFRINQMIDEMTVKTKIICVYEYDAFNK